MEILPTIHFFSEICNAEHLFILLGGILSSCRYRFWPCVTCKGWKRRSSKRQVVQTSISARSMTLRLGGCQPNMRTLFPASTSSAFEFTPGPCSGWLWICIDLNSNLQAKMMEFASWIDKFCPVNPRPPLILSMSWTRTLPHRFVTILEEVWIESFESLFKRLFDKNLWFAELFKNYQADMTLWFTFHISKRFWTAPFDLTAWSLILRNFAHDLLNGDPFRDQGVCSKGFVQNFWD